MDTMHWTKQGLIYQPDGSAGWRFHSALQPTPIVLNAYTIRVFVGFRDCSDISRVGFVDVDIENPSEIRHVSEQPVLDIGQSGRFDENGVVPCAVIRRGEALYLYYAGYRKGHSVRFSVFGGLAISHDNGLTFERLQEVPVLDRRPGETLFRVAHTVLWDDDVYKVWYGAGDTFRPGKTKTLPQYNIRYLESGDATHFPGQGQVVLDVQEDEYRVGRPYVVKTDNGFAMFFCAGTEEKGYRLAYAESPNGLSWTRHDKKLNLDVSAEGWDSEMMAYPAIIRHREKTYLFYNGNRYGHDGFGYAILLHGNSPEKKLNNY